MQKMHPGIGDTKGGPERVRKRLAEVLPLVWDTLESEYLEDLWRSMPSRVCGHCSKWLVYQVLKKEKFNSLYI